MLDSSYHTDPHKFYHKRAISSCPFGQLSHYTPDLSRQAIPLVSPLLNGVLSKGSDLLLMVVAAALGTIAVHIGET